MIKLMEKHPVGTTFIICLLLFLTAGIFFGEAAVVKSGLFYCIIALIFFSYCQTSSQRTIFAFIFAILSLVLLLINTYEYTFLMAELFLLGIFTLLNKHKKNIAIFCFIFGAFILHLFYIQSTPIDIRQHDLNGIILYMKLITQNGLNWHNFDPWYMYYLFHQPLHFFIIGHIYLAEISIWNSHILALTNLQYLSLFYVTGATIFAYKIFSFLGFKEKTLYAMLLFFAFNPSLTLFSGYISDDAPLLFWSMAVVYYSLRWYETPSTFLIIIVAICFGLGTLTKLSLLMLAPALSFLFLYKLLTANHKDVVLKHLSIFVIIAVPLSLIWVIRNHIGYDMQFYHIPDTSPQGQRFLHLSLSERLSDFSKLFTPFIDAPHIVDANIWLALIKTELFGEWDLSLLHSNILLPAKILYTLNIFLKLSSLYGCFYLIYKRIQKSGNENILEYFFIILYFTLWGYSLKYAMDYPYICSTDYRLFIQLMLPEIIILGLLYRNNYKQRTFFLSISVLYALCSLYIYTLGI